ncbi:MAG: SRPBCC family protein [Rhizobiales bacterium]|nr:SRPBCC family protein [Hyphomicrobiales bacterium]
MRDQNVKLAPKFFKILITLLTFISFTSIANAGNIKLTSNQQAYLQKGGLLSAVTPDPNGAAGMVQAVIDIPVPPSVLWQTMLDCKGTNKFIKGLKKCAILARDPKGKWDIREHVVSWLALMPTTRSEFRSVYSKHKSIKFSRTGGDLKTLEGEWNLEPINKGKTTRLTYMARVDPGTFLPPSMIRAAVEADLPKTLKALRDEAIRRENAK